MLYVNELYTAFQGEGATIGKPCWFLRLSGCDLSCEWCDSKYTWHKDYLEKALKYNCETLAHLIAKAPTNINRLVITGGEPLLQMKGLAQLQQKIELIKPFKYEIETNGLRIPEGLKIDNLNISPKLSTSGVDRKSRYKKEVLEKLSAWDQAIFKFVITSKEDIKEILNDYNFIDKDKIYLMPQGVSIYEQRKNSKGVIKWCTKHGFNFSPRVHILISGNKRKI